MKNIIALFLFLFAAGTLIPQSYFIPRNIQLAYDKGTRSPDGRPGKNYWQNHADYEINVSVDPVSRLLNGHERIRYYNNSPDSLSMLVIRNYHDFNLPNAARNFQINSESITEGVIIEKVLIAGKEIDLESSSVRRTGTNMFINLANALKSNSTLELEITWNLEIPKSPYPRMGAYDDEALFIAYWYPQISVYDDIDGWDVLNYNGEQEFYYDFCNFDVKITAPNNFAVWATGMMQNPSELLQQTYLERYNLALQSDTVINIITAGDLASGNIFNQSNAANTWHYKAWNVPDFTFALSSNYLWDALSIQPEGKQERVYVAAAYREESKDFYRVAEISRQSIEFFSSEMPAVPYPYPSCVVWNGSGGMEFPMIINNGSSSTLAGTVGVTSHEIAHQYFPFYMGINERKYAWMDEGFAVMFPFDFQERMVEHNYPRERNAAAYETFAGMESELPLIYSSYLARGTTYRMHAYSRPAFAFEFLRDFLGDEKFLSALHEFMDRWNGKHPIPYDFFFTFEDHLNENLDWYFLPWFFERGYPDLGIKDVSVSGNKISVTVEKIGNLPIPIQLAYVAEDGNEVIEYKSADIWSNGEKEIIIEKEIDFPVVLIDLGAGYIPDSNKNNNMFQIR
jgi:hypothetical protein